MSDHKPPKTPRKIRLHWLYQPLHNKAIETRLRNSIKNFKNAGLSYEARVIENLLIAQSNYQSAQFAFKQRHLRSLSPYKHSLHKAIKEGQKLTEMLNACPCANIFGLSTDLAFLTNQELGKLQPTTTLCF